MELSTSTIIVAVGLFLLLALFLTILAKPIKWAMKLLINALVGFVILFIVNFFGGFIGLNITVGWISALVAGILGIPGVILLILVETFIL